MKCNFPTQVDDRLQRDIFIIGLNETFKKFRSDVISRENLSTLRFSQVISKTRDLEAGLNSESAITKQQLEEMIHSRHPPAPTDFASKMTPDVLTTPSMLVIFSNCHKLRSSLLRFASSIIPRMSPPRKDKLHYIVPIMANRMT